MGLFSRTPAAPFISEAENKNIVEAIRQAEQKTSGEIRVYIEGRCKFVDPLDRAAELFHSLNMDRTAERNAVLVYVAVKDQQLALYADRGIHEKTGPDFWKREVGLMLSQFNRSNYAQGTEMVIRKIGEALYQHFPYNRETDQNELSDDIVFGQ